MALTVRENLLRAIRHQDPDHIPYYGEGGLQYIDYNGSFPPEDGRDLWGVRWSKPSDVPDMLPYAVEHPAKDLEALFDWPFPDPADPALYQGVREQIDRANNLVVARHLFALFTRCWTLLGLEKTLVAMVTEPEAMAAFLLRLADWEMEVARRFIEMGVDAGRVSDDYGSQRALLMSPATWHQVIKPALARICAFYVFVKRKSTHLTIEK